VLALTTQEISRRLSISGLIFVSKNNKQIKYRCIQCGYKGHQYISGLGKRGCGKCRYKKSSITRRLHLKEFRERFKKQGLKLLSLEIRSTKQNLDYECLKCNYKGQKTASNVVKNGCYRCGRQKSVDLRKISQKDAAIAFQAKRLVLVGKYKNAHTPVEYRCERCGNESEITYDVILRCKFGCIKCAAGSRAKDKKLTFADVEQYFNKMNLQPHINEDEYKNSKQMIPYQCLRCGLYHAASTSNVMSGRGCPKCGVNNRTEKIKLSYKEVQSRFAIVELELLEKTYSNSKRRLLYRCKKCSYVGKTSLASVDMGSGCRECGNEKISNTKLRKFFANSNKGALFGSTTLNKAKVIVKTMKEEFNND